MWKTVRDTRGDLLHPSYNTAAFFHNFFIIMMISKKSVGLLLVFFSLRIFPGQQQLNSFFHFKKRKNINDVGIINYKKERMHLPSSVWEWHCKRKVFSFFRLGCCCFQALGLGWLVMGDVRKIPSRATGEFRAADMDCVDAVTAFTPNQL